MPARNIVKSYQENGYYHIYNRGVEKRKIFTDARDESVFLKYLQDYLSPKDVDLLMSIVNDPDSKANERDRARKMLRMNNFCGEITLLAYCLMPNHIHLLVKQNKERSLEKFMRSISTRYVQYFNKSHGARVGGLFQDIYKAVQVTSEEQLLYLTRYIHRNPVLALQGSSLQGCGVPSSYGNYLGKMSQAWVRIEEILGYFAKSGVNSYQAFVEGNEFEEQTMSLISNLALDSD